MDITQIIAAAETTSRPWIGKVGPAGSREAILTFATRVTAASVALTLREAGALVNLTRSPYGETILAAVWMA